VNDPIVAVIVEAEKRLRQLQDEMAADPRIRRAEGAIATLREVFACAVPEGEGQRGAGLTDAIRTILRDACAPVSLSEIRSELPKFGIEVCAYRQPASAVATAIRRLVDRGEIHRFSEPTQHGFRYRLKGTDDTQGARVNEPCLVPRDGNQEAPFAGCVPRPRSGTGRDLPAARLVS
jgi:hypothetical protein